MRALGLILLLSGCSSFLGLEDGTELTADAGVTPPDLFDAPIAVVELYVDPAAGDDANDGSITAPFATITHAVSLAQPGWIVRLAPGTYDQSSGESFPIVVSVPDVEIAGPVDSAQPATISSDSRVFELGDSFLHDVELSSACGDGVAVAAGGRVEQVRIEATLGAGIRSSSIDVTLASNIITNSASGIAIAESNATVDGGNIRDNFVFDNVVGLDLELVADVSIGGQNELSCNTDADVRVTGAELFAIENHWDHVPPTSGNIGGGIDITTLDGGAVDATNAILAQNPCP